MSKKPLNIMIVDDEEDNVFILQRSLRRGFGNGNFEVKDFNDWQDGCSFIEKDAQWPDVIVLDRMMPGIDGMEITNNIRQNPETAHIPVIIQSGKVGNTNHQEAIAAGAYYYLTKPFDPEDFVKAIRGTDTEVQLRHRLKTLIDAIPQAENEKYNIKTIDEAYECAAAIGKLTPHPLDSAVALAELIINGIEHGNLNLGYEAKGKLVNEGGYEEELTKRLEQPENAQKTVTLLLQKESDTINCTISDEGNGFQWKKYIHYDPERITDTNGRGIAKANSYCTSLKYNKNGNEVTANFALGA